MSKPPQPHIAELAEKIALELIFAEPGKDGGLLPINCLLGEVELSCADAPPAEPVPKALELARQWVDAALEAGALSNDSIAWLGTWCSWMREAISAQEQSLPCPGLPEALTAPPGPQPPVAHGPMTEHACLGEAALPAEADSEESVHLDVAKNGDLLREFAQEAHEHLQRIEDDALALEKAPDNTDALNSVFRSFHTIKGGSGFLNIMPMNRLAHELETLLDLTRQGKLRGQPGLIDIILAGRDTLRQFVLEIEQRLTSQGEETALLVPTWPLLNRIRAIQEGRVAPPPNWPHGAFG